jgi:hypothetical protein
MSQEAYTIVVPTRDSGRWISILDEAYKILGMRPLYLYDRRSSDRTLETLEQRRANVVSVTPSLDRVEGVLSVTRDLVSTCWVVRLDDDEFPSASLITWLNLSLPTIDASNLALSRRDVYFFKGRLCFSRLEDYYFHPEDPTYLDPQWRVFKSRHVDFIENIHTPGFENPESTAAPPSAYFVHFDWIMRSFAERWEKLKRYERQAPGAGWANARFYLPELHAPEDHRWLPLDTREFDALARRIGDATRQDGRRRSSPFVPFRCPTQQSHFVRL